MSEASFDEKSDEIANILGEDYFEIIMAMKDIYDMGSLAGIMKGHNYLSQARVASYEKHKEDLKLLKNVIRKYCSKEDYDNFFNSEADGSYASYVGSYNSKTKQRRVGNKRSSEELYKAIKKLLKNVPAEDADVQRILMSIENETFLPKQLTASNGVIPNQVHVKEMKKILSNAERYLPFLREKDETGLSVSEKIMKLFSFQIPYYVGPTTEKSNKDGGNGWVVRKKEGQVLPWNIDEKIDMKATSEAFISRMVRRCTYISGEPVLPKSSLEYQSFCVLNEINNIKIDGEKIEVKKNVTYPKTFEVAINENPEITAKMLQRFFKPKKGKITEITVTGNLVEGGSTVNITEDDIPDDIKELIEMGLYSEEEAEKKIAVGNGNRERRMIIVKPDITYVGTGDDRKPTVAFEDGKYDEDDLYFYEQALLDAGAEPSSDDDTDSESEETSSEDDDLLAMLEGMN